MKKFYFLIISLLFVFQVVESSQLYAQCLAPTQLSVTANAQNSVTITWASSNTASQYNIRYQTAGSLNWTVVNNVTSPLTLTGLSCGSTYVGQLQQVCFQTGTTAPLYSDWANVTFTTFSCTSNPCPAPTGLVATNVSQTGAVLSSTAALPANGIYNIRYHGGNATTWTTLTNVTLPYQLGNLACGTTFEWQAQQVCSNASSPANTVLSPWSTGAVFTTLACSVQCPTPTGPITTNISQNSATLGWDPNIIAMPTIYNIRYHSANSTAWIVVNNVTAPYQLANLTCGTGYVWQVQQICSANSEPSTWTTGTTFSTLACTNPCATPSGLVATNVSQNGAVLTWGPTSTPNNLYNIRYHTGNSTTWITINNVTMPYQLGNLPCGTVFEWQVQQVCANSAGAASVSSWSAGSAFTTLACTNPCVAPTSLTVAFAGQTSVILNWGGSANTLFNIRYHAANSTTWTVVNNVPMPYELVNLPCGTTFEWQVQQICSNSTPGTISGLSPWSAGSTFTTLACPNSCIAPTGQTTTNITQNSAVLNWIGSTTSNSLFNIRYHSASSATWIVINNVTSPYQLGNLPCSNGFVWQVQQVCSTAADPSPWSVGSTFSTLACPNPCITPTGLTATNATQNGVVLSLGTNTSPNNTYNIRYHSGNSTVWITINNVTFPYQLGNLPCGTTFEWQAQQICGPATGTTAALSPWSPAGTFTTLACQPDCLAPTQLSVVSSQTTAVVSWASPNTTTHYNVQYHTDGNPNWIVLNNVSSPLTLTGLTCGSVYILQVQQICINAAGVASVSPWSIVTFTTLPCQNPCVPPVALEATNISQNGAVLHWGPSATTSALYNIRYHSGNSTAWIVVNNVSMPYQLGNLACGTTYEWQVQQICSTTPGTISGLSPWSAGSTFTTLACSTPCATPVGLTATNITQTGAVLYWGPTTITNGLYNIRFHAGNSTAWITINNVTMPYQLGNLTCGTVYEWQVQRICNDTSNGLSAWSTAAVFTTLACQNDCAAPTGLSATNITQSSAVLNWGPASTPANLYNIRYRTPNTTAWSIVNNVSMPYQLGNLSCSAGYIWQVQRICSNAAGAPVVSPWSVSATFATAPCQIACAAPTGLGANDVMQTTAILHWGVVSGAVAYVVNYRPMNTTSPFITVTTNTNSIAISGLIPGTVYAYQVRSICANGTTATNMSPWSTPYIFTTLSALVVYPNPANDVLRMNVNVTAASEVIMQLRDSFGQLVLSSTEMATEGYNEFKMDTSGISAGFYVLTIKTNTETYSSKVFVVH